MRSVVVIALVAACHAAAPAPAVTSVGFRKLEVVDPQSKTPMLAAVFYPAVGPADAHTMVDLYPIAAGADLPVHEGRFPLVAISHGHGGTLWGHHDLAAALARHGYVVAVVEHAGDNYHDQEHFRSDRVQLGRAYQISATIDAVLALPIGEHIDATRIGVAGFSAGGWTSLLLIGSHPDFSLVAAYCKRHPDDPGACGGPLALELDHPAPTVDHRVKAAFVMAPFAVPFGEGAFRDVTAPFFLTWGEADPVLPPSENAEHVLRAPSLAGKRSYPGAGHYVFIPPCSPAFAKLAGEICVDPPGVDRAKIHDQINADAVQFFDAALHVR